MSRVQELDNSPIAAGVRPSPPGWPLPWSWPEGARALLAILAMLGALGLLFGGRGSPRGAGPVVTAAELRLDPNEATAEALEALPQIGPTLARRIVEAKAAGPFHSASELRARVRGIGPVTLARIEPYLRFEKKSDEPRRLDPAATPTVIADASTDTGERPATTSRKPPRARARKARSSSVQLAAKAGASASP